MVRRSLFNDLIRIGSFYHADLAEVAEEVRPHNMVLVDVGALDLRHRDEVIGEERAIVLTNSAHLCQALVTVEEELLPLVLQLLTLLCQHEPEAYFFVLE